MPIHLHRSLNQLRKEVLAVGGLVEEALDRALSALTDRRPELGQQVIEGDRQVDEREIQVEEECLKILALHQPVANDLRYVVAMMKVNNDLERVGDLARNLAERAITLAQRPPLEVPQQILEMGELTRVMLRDTLNAVVQQDQSLAHAVLRNDTEVDSRHEAIYGVLQELMRKDPERIGDYVQLLSVSRYLERSADLATNIAEDVIFMVEGRVIRHGGH